MTIEEKYEKLKEQYEWLEDKYEMLERQLYENDTEWEQIIEHNDKAHLEMIDRQARLIEKYQKAIANIKLLINIEE